MILYTLSNRVDFPRMLTIRRLFFDSMAEKVEEVINSDLPNVDQWYEQDGIKRNTCKYQAIVMGKSQVMPQFYCENTAIPINKDLQMLGVTFEDKMKFERHIHTYLIDRSPLGLFRANETQRNNNF